MTTVKERSIKHIEKSMDDLAKELLMIASYLNRLDIRQFSQTGLDRVSRNIIIAEKHCKKIENLVGLYGFPLEE